MVTITITNIVPLKKDTRIRVYAKELSPGKYQAQIIQDQTSGVEYHAYNKPKEKAEYFQEMERSIAGIRWRSFKINQTEIYKDQTEIEAEEIA